MMRFQNLVFQIPRSPHMFSGCFKNSEIIILRTISSKPSDFLRVPLRTTQVHQLFDIRYLRTQSRNTKTEETPESEPKSDDPKEGKNPKDDLNEKLKNLDPAAIKKLRIFMLMIVTSTCVMSYIMFNIVTQQDQRLKGVAGQEPVDFEAFLKTYLPTGEIEKIVYCPEEKKAIAVLRPDALIDGQPPQSAAILITYDRPTGQQQNQFKFEVRHAEEKLGITVRDSIPIEVIHGISGFRIAEMTVAFLILGFLGTQYGRLLRRTILKKRAEDAAKAASKK